MNYIGIDLGTTNSAICSYDGKNVRIWKSPEQNDVTPSAIYIDKRGNRFYGQRAYDNAPRNPGNSATLFKRFMGTDEKIVFKGIDLSMTPEECSSEILKVLFGYLPEDIRQGSDVPVVITVPAAFNQMKKDATLEAANLAGFQKVSLMQEPVAAVMSVMRASNAEGVFLIYDLGGGTFDLSIAENIGGTVNLLSHGGVEMCGGRDWDRAIVNSIVIPWLRNNFHLPDDLLVNPNYKTLISLAHWASEKAKIELSAKESAIITLSESEARCNDEDGEEIYIDIPISRTDLNTLIDGLITDTIKSTRETMSKAGLTANDIERIVFVGGPTNYIYLRERVCDALSLKADLNVNPMTAVAEGASIFAESINWDSVNHARKGNRASGSVNPKITFNYIARVSDDSSKIGFSVKEQQNYSVEVVSLDTGWTSGRASLNNMLTIDLPLHNQGENKFKVIIYDEYGQPIQIKDDVILITKTYGTVSAIPASHSISIQSLSALGGSEVLSFLVKEGENLPKKGSLSLKAAEPVKAGSYSSINIKLWEGEIESPITDNRFIGVIKITGQDFDSGIIAVGAEIVCEYEISDSGTLNIEVSIPSIGATFSRKNFYSRQEGQENALDTDSISEGGSNVLARIEEMKSRISDSRLEDAKKKAQNAAGIGNSFTTAENIMSASNDLLNARKTLFEVRRDHLQEIRQSELDGCYTFFNNSVRKYATKSEEETYDNQVETAQRAIDRNEPEFENILYRLRCKNFDILWRQDWYVIDRFRRDASNPYNYTDYARYQSLKALGEKHIKDGNIRELRNVYWALCQIEVRSVSIEDMDVKTNIVRG